LSGVLAAVAAADLTLLARRNLALLEAASLRFEGEVPMSEYLHVMPFTVTTSVCQSVAVLYAAIAGH